MASPEICITSLINFERQFHTEVFKWIEWKISGFDLKNAEILDFSVDNCIFTFLLWKSMQAKRLVTAVRGDQPTELIEKSIEIKKINGLSNDKLEELLQLGLFDIIIVKEITHEVESLTEFLVTLKKMLKSDDSRIFVLAHPKNPPPPIPDVAVPFWRKLAPNREDVLSAAKTAEMGQVCYCASCPIKVAKQEWYNILKLRVFPALRECKKCTDKEIREFANGIRMFAFFEEKILIYLITPHPEQGDRMEREEEPTQQPISGGGGAAGAGQQPMKSGAGAAPGKPDPGAMVNPKMASEKTDSVFKPKVTAKASLNAFQATPGTNAPGSSDEED